ncbi:MAG: hypothetical protein H8E15_13700 [Planctomycetes bacterium]|nr:hypothetical protein [Planctomycetota bacterium]
MKTLLPISLALTLSFIGCATAPLETTPNIGITARHVDSEFRYSGEQVQIIQDADEIKEVKSKGPSTIQVLIGDELTGDFKATMTILFPSRKDPNARVGGGGRGTPYVGFRSSDGGTETLCNVPGLPPEPTQRMFKLSRVDGEIEIRIDDAIQKAFHNQNSDPGYLYVHMNDVSTFTLQDFKVFLAE